MPIVMNFKIRHSMGERTKLARHLEDVKTEESIGRHGDSSQC